MSTGAPLVPVILIPDTGVIVSPWVYTHFRITRVIEVPVSTIMAPLVAVTPSFIWETTTPM